MVWPVSDVVDLLRAGAAHQQAGRLPEALEAYEAAVRQRPDLAEGHYFVGSAFTAMGLHKNAIPALTTALTLNRDLAEAWSELGSAHILARDLVLARIALDKAAALKPQMADNHYRRGQAMLALGEREAAITEFRRGSAVDCDIAAIWTNLGATCQALERHREARLALRRALTLQPALPLALDNLGALEQVLGEVRAALPHHRRSIASGNLSPDPHSNIIMAMTYLPEVTADHLYGEMRAWETRYVRERYREIRPHDNRREPDRRLKIGYLSADLFSHPVGINILGLIGARDRNLFAAYCYASVEQADGLTEYLRADADGWCDTRPMRDEAIAEQIRKDEIDILMVMAGHTGRNRLGVAAYKPAPIQISYGDLTTTGLEVMDYWLTDAFLSPDGVDERFTEALLHVPMMVLHQPPPTAPDVSPLPAAAAGTITFGSCNNPAKLNDRVLALWAEILDEVPGSRLLLKYRAVFDMAEVKDRFARRLAEYGVARGRLIFAGGKLPRREQLMLVGGVDIALDPFPFTGCTATFEALWMGVPVITLAGTRFLGRMGTSFLTHAGLTELVAADAKEYRSKAVALARDLPRLAAMRASLRARIAGSPLCATEWYARTLEAAFRDVWRRWCAR
ncbi:MAG: tetratricopeptide repeat protein [Proteobacteria bacterium]|nr:tetratricopeptide repeat protein [Pseudomonadota bacterium]